ncbi:MAG: LolA-like outer membrane lipoprotein chaperone [Sulfurimonas sp.]|nr:LolA-like outer membrane lipoprotein chaperone [Sulfurimonas sp.]
MKYKIAFLLFYTQIFASINNITTFEADFTQTVTDDKKKELHYSGYLIASSPQNAKWTYITPIKKTIYINKFQATIVEPEIEQVIKRKISSNFDFFKIIENAKKIDKNLYLAKYDYTSFTLEVKNNILISISYLDQLENSVKIVFKNQSQNKKIDKNIFIPKYPLDFDIIRD